MILFQHLMTLIGPRLRSVLPLGGVGCVFSGARRKQIDDSPLQVAIVTMDIDWQFIVANKYFVNVEDASLGEKEHIKI